MTEKQVDVEIDEIFKNAIVSVIKYCDQNKKKKINEELALCNIKFEFVNFRTQLKILFKEKARKCVIPEFIKGKCTCSETYRMAVNDCREWIFNNIDSKFK